MSKKHKLIFIKIVRAGMKDLAKENSEIQKGAIDNLLINLDALENTIRCQR